MRCLRVLRERAYTLATVTHSKIRLAVAPHRLYFLAWSVSFYPQAWDNYKRKSVVGLNFDFLYLNLMGWVCYSAYNVGLFCVPSVRAEYQERHPGGDIPVKPNDVFFALHAFVLTLVTIYQTTIYEVSSCAVLRLESLVLVEVRVRANARVWSPPNARGQPRSKRRSVRACMHARA